MEYVVLVDEQDNEIGVMEKMQAHKEGKLHRAISVFIFNAKGEFLLQRRAEGKYHSAGLWTNACCSHPRPGEKAEDTAKRRLLEEMGLKCKLKKIFSFIYKSEFDNELTEHEFDHVFLGITDDIPSPDKSEVLDCKYIDLQQLTIDIDTNNFNYTTWFKICLPAITSYLNKYSLT